MSILCGLIVQKYRFNGSSYHEKQLYECSDLDDTREKIRQAQKSGLQWKNWIKHAELHDTDTGRTWSVDGGGMSQKDYHYEDSERFRKRWIPKWRRI